MRDFSPYRFTVDPTRLQGRVPRGGGLTLWKGAVPFNGARASTLSLPMDAIAFPVRSTRGTNGTCRCGSAGTGHRVEAEANARTPELLLTGGALRSGGWVPLRAFTRLSDAQCHGHMIVQAGHNFVGLLESLMTAKLVDDITDTRKIVGN